MSVYARARAYASYETYMARPSFQSLVNPWMLYSGICFCTHFSRSERADLPEEEVRRCKGEWKRGRKLRTLLDVDLVAQDNSPNQTENELQTLIHDV